MQMERLYVSNLSNSRRRQGILQLSMATRFLTLGAATIISCLLISLGMYQYRQAAQLANNVNKRMSELSVWLAEEELLQYEGTELSGAEVVSFYKRYFAGTEVLPDFCMVLVQNGQEYSLDTSGLLELLQTEGEELYCIPQAVYVCSVIRNRNDVITEISFEKQ